MKTLPPLLVLCAGFSLFLESGAAQQSSLLTRAGTRTAIPAGRHHSVPDVSYPSSGSCLAVWETADSSEGENSDITARLLPLNELSKNWISGAPFPLCAQQGSQSRPAVSLAAGGFVVVWEDSRNAPAGIIQKDIYYSLVSSSGTVLNPSGWPLSTQASDESDVEICMGNSGGLVVWENASPSQICGVRLKPDGRPLDTVPFIIAEYANYAHPSEPCVATDGQRFFVGWERERFQDQTLRIQGRVISGTGMEPELSTPWEIGTSMAKEAECSVACQGEQAVVAWSVGKKYESVVSVVIRRVPMDGSPPAELPVLIAKAVRPKDYQLRAQAYEGVGLVTAREVANYENPVGKPSIIMERTSIRFGEALEIGAPVQITQFPAEPGHFAIIGTYPRLYVWEDSRWHTYKSQPFRSERRQIFARCQYDSLSDANDDPWGVVPNAGVLLSAADAVSSTTGTAPGNGRNLAWIQTDGTDGNLPIVAGDVQGNTAPLDVSLPTGVQPDYRLPGRVLDSADGPEGAITASIGVSGLLAQSMAKTYAYQVTTAALPWLDFSGFPAPEGVALAQTSLGAALLRTMMDHAPGAPKCKISIVTSRRVRRSTYEREFEDFLLAPVPASADLVAPLLVGGTDSFCAVIYPRNAPAGAPQPVWCQVLGHPFEGHLSPGEWRVAAWMESSRAPMVLANGGDFVLFTPNEEDSPGPAWRMTEISASGVPGTVRHADFARDAAVHKTDDGYLVFEPSAPRFVTFDRAFQPRSAWGLTGSQPIPKATAAGWDNNIATFTAIAGDESTGFYPCYFGWKEPHISGVRVLPGSREVDFHFPTGITLEIESSADLISWKNLARSVAVPLWNPENGGLMTLRDVAPAGDRLFYRLCSPHLKREAP